MTTAVLAGHLLGRLTAATLETDPWAHAYLPDALPADLAGELAASFAALGLTEFEETQRAKSYRFRTAEVHGPTAASPPGPGPLAAVVDVLTSPGYRARVGALTGVDLAARPVTVDLWEYHTGDWLAPHVDKADKVVTQIFYLTEGWAPGDGGRLLVLRSSSAEDVHRALPPRPGSSAVLVRSAASWHAVEPPGPRSPVRRSVTATFWRGAGPAARTG
jgi:hypothetical protein